ncbi:MAG: urea ABC transporter ATP-binding subunit UrtE [Betaproteobacteria bacterium]|nr:urea ABC transporter ATP-binding subunit UrtE [Betaproteobacteria bacterium]
MLELREVASYYGNTPVLQDFSVRVAEGEFVAVLGRNGVGKTTLLKTIMGLTDRADGRIVLGGRDLAAMPTHLRALQGIGYVPQGRGIIPHFTVRENIVMGTFARRDRRREIPPIALDLFPALREGLNRMGGVLSGGQQQQLAIARALAADPRIILLDEPTEGIQPNIVEQIEQAIARLNREHRITIVLVEQNVDFARRAAQRFIIMEKGRIAVEGAVGELTDQLVHRHMAV